MKKKLIGAVALTLVVSSTAAFANAPATSKLPDRFLCGFFNTYTALLTGHWPMTCPY